MTKTIEDKEQFISLRAKGYSFDRIAEEIGVSKPTLLKWQVEFLEEIKEAQYFEMENIVNEYKVMRSARTEAFSQVLSSALHELKERAKNNELENLSTDRLLNLALLLEKRLEKDTKRKLLSVHSDPVNELVRNMNETYIEVE